MRIKYRANGLVRDVRDSIGKALIANGIAQAYGTREIVPEPQKVIEPAVVVKPKRKYTRRDMTSEE